MKGRRYRLFGFSQAGSFFGDTGFKIFSTSSFANATNETVYPMQWKNCPESEVTAIYALQFDGVNDTLNVDTPVSGITWVEMDISNLDYANVNVGQRLFSGDGFLQDRNETQFRWKGSLGVNVTFFKSNFPNNYPITTITTVRIEDDGVNSVLTIGNESSTGATSGSPIQVSSFFGINNAQVECTEIRLSNGNVYNDANNWSGLTNDGATRVVTSDNGATWTPAP